MSRDTQAGARVRAALNAVHRTGCRTIPLGSGDVLYLADLYALLDAQVIVKALSAGVAVPDAGPVGAAMSRMDIRDAALAGGTGAAS